MSDAQNNPFRQAFQMWERTTSAYFDALVRNTAFLTASGTSMNSIFELKKLADLGMRQFLTAMGLPTRRDQERTLDLLQKIEGRLDDLQFQLQGREPTPPQP
jgi:hypothetical protein